MASSCVRSAGHEIAHLTGGYRSFQYVPKWCALAIVRGHQIYKWRPGTQPMPVFQIPDSPELKEFATLELGLSQLYQASMAINPAADQLAISYSTDHGSRLELYNLHTRSRTLLANVPLDKNGGSWIPDVNLAWSPNGSLIAFGVPGRDAGDTDGMAEPLCIIVDASGKTVRTARALPYGWLSNKSLLVGRFPPSLEN